MRLLALTVATAVLLACPVAAMPTTRVAAAAPDASVVAVVTPDDEVRGELPAPTGEPDPDDDSETETEDPSDDSDLELLGVLPSLLSFAILASSAQRWTRTHARPSDDPDPTDPRRPPISA